MLTDVAVKAAAPHDDGRPRKWSDGRGLYLYVTATLRSWRFDHQCAGKRKTAVLGGYPVMTLKSARAAAEVVRQMLAAGLDPAQERIRIADEAALAARQAREGRLKAEQEAREKKAAEIAAKKAEAATLARVARDHHERLAPKFRNPKHAAQWINSLEQHVPREVWHSPIGSVTSGQLLDAVVKVSRKLPETGSRIAQRLGVVFADAQFRGTIDRDPMAYVAKKAREVLGKKPEAKHHPMLPYRLIPAALTELGTIRGVAGQAVRFAILTAARSGEVRGMTWGEVDLEAATWIVPGTRMKGGTDHFVPLSEAAVALLKDRLEVAGNPVARDALVFPSPVAGAVLSPDALEDILDAAVEAIGHEERATVHGTARATFSTWAAEQTAYSADVVEACLAHREADRVRRAYMRAGFEQDRRRLLDAWGAFCTKQADASVMSIDTARAA
jgi:integrase